MLVIILTPTVRFIPDFDIDEFTEKIDLLISDKKLREKFGNKARELVEEKFEIDNTLMQIEKILN
jgi:glycosyltransferase involved in cell wall biosynthesis